MHHRFGPRPLAGLGRNAQKVAVEVAPHRHHGMGQQMDGDLAAIEFVGDRIDQKRHVVVDDLHDGVAAFEAMVGDGGIEYADLGDAGQAAAGEGEQGDRGGGALLGRGGCQILVGDAAEEAAGEMGHFLAAAGLQAGGADGIQAVDTRRQCNGHGSLFLPAGGRQMLPATWIKSSIGTVGSAVPVILGVSANFRQFPPARSLRLYPFDLLAFWGFRHFRHFRRRFLEVPLSKAVLGARKGRRKAGWVGVCRPAMGLALEVEKHDVGLRSDAQLVKYQFRNSQAIL